MRRFLPKSLIGQIALVMALALLVAQAINFGLIFTERQRVSRAQIEGPAVSRFVAVAQRLAGLPPGRRTAQIPERSRRGSFSIDPHSLLPPAAGDPRLLERLRDSSAANGLVFRDLRAASVDRVRLRDRGSEASEAGDDDRRRRWLRSRQTLILSAQLGDGSWLNARIVTARPNAWLALRPLAATLLTYLIVLAAMVWVAARLARPLRDLTAAAERFQGQGEAPRVEPRGPADLSRAIHAFNAMSARVGAMLDEKDRMLGAIGHDLRTPLASLRIRAESVEPEAERREMIATIEEMAAMLDDTLALARSGRAVEPVRDVDVSALADAVVEELRALGRPIEMIAGERQVARVQPRLLRRAVRNLAENAVAYGGSARLAVQRAQSMIAIDVEDEGPGIPESELEKVFEAFYRREPSRSRETGGSGLGLTLARAAAQAHGGSLELSNLPQGGLRARILLPTERKELGALKTQVESPPTRSP